MPKPSAQVTAADISRLAGVTRATVSNWRRRHADFPGPSGGTDASPLYDLAAVQAWLAERGHTAAASAAEELRAALRLRGAAAATRALPLVLAAAQQSDDALAALAEEPYGRLVERARAAVAGLAASVPQADSVTYDEADADVLRALLRCVREEGGTATLNVLAERELEDSAATGAYTTPAPLAELMARLLAPPPGQGPYPGRVLDPACGSGSLLAAAAALGARQLHAQDTIAVQAQRTAVRLRLAAPGAEVTARVGDSLREDAFPDLAADAALSNPPYGDRDWGHDELAYDPRWAYGVPPRAEPELAWVQHVLAHLAPGGRAVLLLPPATASRPSGRRVRTELLRAGALRGVIALPPGAAIPLHIGLHLWLLQRPEAAPGAQQSVLFIDLSAPAGVGSRSGQGAIDWPALTATALDAWDRFRADPEHFTGEPRLTRAVPVIDLLDDQVDLTPGRQIRTAPATTDPAEAARQVEESGRRLRAALATLTPTAELGSWPPSGDAPRAWRTATVADLARGGALAVLRTSVAADEAAEAVTIEEGDVLLPRVAAPPAGGGTARVADKRDAGEPLADDLILFRPDRQRLDSWFLAGFLAAADNISGATTGTLRSNIQIDPRRLRVPLLTLTEQRAYGDAFRRLHDLRSAARDAARLADETAAHLTLGLTSGTLLPPPEAAAGPANERRVAGKRRRA
jgi:methylase of polypeptide subunit release factors